MKYVLDTNAISALMAGHPAVTARLATMNRANVWLPQPALAEIAYGIARLPKSRRRSWLDDRRALIAGTLPRAEWTDAVSTAFGQIKTALERRGEPIEDFDAAIAAHALASDAVLVTADRRHLTRVPGVIVEDWSQ